MRTKKDNKTGFRQGKLRVLCSICDEQDHNGYVCEECGVSVCNECVCLDGMAAKQYRQERFVCPECPGACILM